MSTESDEDLRPPLSMKEVMPDTAEMQIAKLEDHFPILKSRVLFLNSKLTENTDHFNAGLLRQNKEEYEAALKYLTSCSQYHLQSHMLKQIVAGHQLLKLVIEPESSSSVKESTKNRILERLDVSMQMSLELRALQSELAEAKKELKNVEADYFVKKKNLVDQLDSDKKEIDTMANTRDIDVTVEDHIATRIKRINFMRTLMVMLISTSGKNLMDPVILKNCIKFSETFTLRDVQK